MSCLIFHHLLHQNGGGARANRDRLRSVIKWAVRIHRGVALDEAIMLFAADWLASASWPASIERHTLAVKSHCHENAALLDFFACGFVDAMAEPDPDGAIRSATANADAIAAGSRKLRVEECLWRGAALACPHQACPRSR
jgi:hypothetical protein